MDRTKGRRKSYDYGPNHPNWKGGRYNSKIVYVYAPNNPHSDCRGYILEHNLIAEEILGEPLPDKAVVHHIDSNPLNNNHDNLVICQDAEHHHLLHCRTRAIQGCGDPNKRYCKLCDSWKNINDFPKRKGLTHAGRCKKCDASKRH